MNQMIFPRVSTSFGTGLPVLALAFAAVFLAGCQKTEQAAPPPPPMVEVADVVQRDVPVYQEWVGTLDGSVNAQILAQVTGYLVKVAYEEGKPIRKGDLLYEIDPRTFKATLAEAQGNLARQQAVLITAQLERRRIERLLPQNAVSVRDRDNAVGHEAAAEAEVLAAKAAVENAQLALGFTRITSPIDGIAGISQAQLGDLVGPGSASAALTTISKVDPIKAFIALSEQQYLRFSRERAATGESRRDIPLELILVDGSIYPRPGRFSFADRQVDVKTGTIKVAIRFDNPDYLLRPGQFARVRGTVRFRHGALLVPQRAVAEMQGKHLVMVVQPDNTVHTRVVQAAETVGPLWVIEQGLKPGERVVVEGLQRLRDGMKVTPKPYTEPEPTTPSAEE